MHEPHAFRDEFLDDFMNAFLDAFERKAAQEAFLDSLATPESM
ncbi:hypothetical protein HMPREF1572_00629 [Gardnerella vaginalis JCP7275]|nr:hypothetical protein HMPREF1572_00629 [Gardnerella vaginalis JCP7275]